ncbi:divalent cation tolerance protein CutA [Haloglycomyces albus]|uniref:divalent-cation tolerance protein CutA n=1 Tax=Haloglycomyces albus TaxID=526067 RepID=UPI000686D61D
MIQISEVLIIGPKVALAELGTILVEERLAASCHLPTEVDSLYWWEGTIQRNNEVRLTLHTRTALVDLIAQRTRQVHPYELPSVTHYELHTTDNKYRQWIAESTKEF